MRVCLVKSLRAFAVDQILLHFRKYKSKTGAGKGPGASTTHGTEGKDENLLLLQKIGGFLLGACATGPENTDIFTEYPLRVNARDYVGNFAYSPPVMRPSIIFRSVLSSHRNPRGLSIRTGGEMPFLKHMTTPGL